MIGSLLKYPTFMKLLLMKNHGFSTGKKPEKAVDEYLIFY
jgi:hypothetical protein